MIEAAAGVTLSIALGWASITKLRDRGAFRQAAESFGVPAPASGPLAVTLPALEALLAIGVVVEPTRSVSAAVSVALLCAFSAVVAGNLLFRQTRPSCGCFGSFSRGPIGGITLLRNAGLVAVALLAAGVDMPRRIPMVRVTLAWVAITVLACALFAVAWLVVRLAGQQGRLLRRMAALERMADPRPASTPQARAVGGDPAQVLVPGASLPELLIHTRGRSTREVRELLHPDRPTALLFLSEHCGPCRSIIENRLRPWLTRGSPARLAVLPLLQSEATAGSEVHSWVQAQDLSRLGLRGVPAVVVVEPGGIVLDAPGYGEDIVAARINAS